MRNGAEILIECLKKEKVSTVFGYPGAAILPVYEAMSHSPLHHVLIRQEQNAAHAAAGYAKISGTVGVCMTTSGPGATNLITGIASAYMDSVPIVAITGQVKSDLIGRDVFQEVDITGACEPFTKHSYLCLDTSDLPRIVKEAFHIASTGRPGPVLIDLPIDIQLNKTESFEYPEKVGIPGYKPTTSGNAMQVDRALKALSESERPVICAGGGVLSAGASAILKTLAQKAQIPVVSTMMGLGVLESDHPLYLGMLGSHGQAAANLAIKTADLILLCGARVGDRAMAAADQIAKQAKIIHIDIDPAEIGKNMKAHIPIVGDLNPVLAAVSDGLDKRFEPWAGHCRSLKCAYSYQSGKQVNPKLFLKTLAEKIPDSCVLCADVGQNQIWSANHFSLKPGDRFLTSGGLGTMGSSIPAAIGAKLANHKNTVIAVCGDGSFQMQMMELATICEQNLDIKIIVMKNAALGMISEMQRKQYNNNCFGTDLHIQPDLMKLCDAYGIQALRLCRNADILPVVNTLLGSAGPCLLECTIDPEENAL